MFIRGKILIVEGPDGVGKTTLLNRIKEKFKNNFYMHLRVHKNMKLWHTATVRPYCCTFWFVYWWFNARCKW